LKLEGTERAFSKPQGGCQHIFKGPWSRAVSSPRYPLKAIHVFRLSRHECSEIKGLKDLLSKEEISRLESMGSRERRSSFLAGRGALRLILSDLLDIPPYDIPISEGRSGRPELEAVPYKDRISLSLSHSGAWILIALREGGRIGIDLELARESQEYVMLARRFFHPDEASALSRLTGEYQKDLFYAIWTMKEACLKAAGRGIAGAMSSFSVLQLLEQVIDGVDCPVVESLSGITAVGIPTERPYYASIAGDPPLRGILLLDCSPSLFL
jgi:4'-phosphopantetheinyl transferase